MPRDSYDPFKDETLGQKARRKPALRIDWKTAARRLAEGAPVAIVAGELGIEEERIWRHLKRSLRFRHYLRQAFGRQRLMTELQLGVAGRAATLGRCLQPDHLDTEMLQYAGSFGGPAAEGKDLIERLGETGNSPPNMALRARIKAERQVMDATVARYKAEVAAADARRRAAAVARTGSAAAAPAAGPSVQAESASTASDQAVPNQAALNQAAPNQAAPDQAAPDQTASSGGPPQVEMDSSGPQRAPVGSGGPQRDSNGQEWSAADSAGESGEYWVVPPPEPGEPPLPPSRASLYRSITDLNGPFATGPGVDAMQSGGRRAGEFNG